MVENLKNSDCYSIINSDRPYQSNHQEQHDPSGIGFFKSLRPPEGSPGFLLNTTFLNG